MIILGGDFLEMEGGIMYLHHENIPWNKITDSSKKKELYSADFYFELSYEAAFQSMQNNLVSNINDYTLLFIKPEALITNKINILIDDLQKHHFELVYVSIKPISHVQISELWKYAWPAASIIRIAINQVYYIKYECGVLVLRNSQCNSKSATNYLSKIKGKVPYSEPYIRYHMDAINTFLNHIHSPDDTSDFLREIAIFFSWDELTEIYRRMKLHITIPFQVLKSLAINYPYHSKTIVPEDALRNLIRKISDDIKLSHQISHKNDLTDIYEELLLIEAQKKKFTHILLEKMKTADVLEWEWSLFVVITQYMEYSTDHDPLI